MSANIRSALLALALGSTLAVAGTSATAQVLVFGEGPLNGGSVGAVRLRNLGNAGNRDYYSRLDKDFVWMSPWLLSSPSVFQNGFEATTVITASP